MDFNCKLREAIKRNRSYVCVGLDPDVEKLPKGIQSSKKPLLDFNREIIDATKDRVCAYKPNLAFYEAQGGSKGIEQLEETLELIPDDIPVILCGKRGDIDNTARMHAKYLFGHLKADAVTANPYMGRDSVEVLLTHPGPKGAFVFILCVTSNASAKEIQRFEGHRGELLFQRVARMGSDLAKNGEFAGRIGYVIGATSAEVMNDEVFSDIGFPFLVPGLGAQHGNLGAVVSKSGLLAGRLVAINASRSVTFAYMQQGATPRIESRFAQYAREKVEEYNSAIDRIVQSVPKKPTVPKISKVQHEVRGRTGAFASRESSKTVSSSRQFLIP